MNLSPIKVPFGKIMRSAQLGLVIFWCIGLLTGILLAAVIGDSAASKLHHCLYQNTDFFKLLTLRLLPFIFAVWSVYQKHCQLLWIIGFIRAVFFGFTTFEICQEFVYSSWLVYPLFLFSDFASTPLLFCYCWRNIDRIKKFSPREAVLFGCGILGICILDHRIVAHFWVSLSL